MFSAIYSNGTHIPNSPDYDSDSERFFSDSEDNNPTGIRVGINPQLSISLPFRTRSLIRTILRKPRSGVTPGPMTIN